MSFVKVNLVKPDYTQLKDINCFILSAQLFLVPKGTCSMGWIFNRNSVFEQSCLSKCVAAQWDPYYISHSMRDAVVVEDVL